MSQFFFKFGYSISYKFVDRGVFEILGPTGLSIASLKIGSGLYKMQSGFIYHYTLIILASICCFFFFKEMLLIFDFFIDYRLFIIIFVLSFFISF